MKMTVAQALVKFIDNQYVQCDGVENKFVEGIFTIFGHGNVLGLGQALEQGNHSLSVLQGKSEQGMALSAMAYAKQNKRFKIMAATSSIGPGAMNMVTAAGCATVNNIPLLLLPGDNFATRAPDPVLQQLEQPHDLSITNNDAFKPVSKFFDRIMRPEMLEAALMNAFRVLTDQEKTGAVVLALPQDVQGESYDFDETMFKKRVWTIKRTIPSTQELQILKNALNEAKKPLIICGGGVKYSLAEKELLEFSETYNIPIAFTQAGKSAISDDYKLSLGGIGVTGNLMANKYLKNADLIIGMGTRLNDFTTQSNTGLKKETNIINVNLSRYDGLKLNSVHIQADIKAVLQSLTEDIKTFDNNTELSSLREQWTIEHKRLTETNKKTIEVFDESNAPDEFLEIYPTSLSQTEVIGKINELVATDDIIVGASGSLPGCLQRMWMSKGENTYHMEYGYSCMGYEINGSVGAKLAAPSSEVYTMVGDGSFNMSHSELLTAIQSNIKINVMLFDNSGFGCINNLQRSKGIDTFRTEFREIKNNIEHDFLKVDYATVASGYGLKTYTINSIEELVVAFEDSKKQNVSTLFDIKVTPKTMTEGYDSFWDVGISHIGKNDAQKKAYEEVMKGRND